MLEIQKVRTRAQRKAFAAYPMRLYKDCPYYSPVFYGDDFHLLNRKKNPALEYCDAECWIAVRGKKVVGRICGIIQKQYNGMWNKKIVRFSRFDCINDVEVAEALFDTVAAWGREHGMDTLAGPWDFNDQGREGLLTKGFDCRSTYATNYAYPYFKDLVTACGFEADSEWVEYTFNLPKEPSEKFQAISAAAQKRFKLRDVTDSMPFPKLIKRYGHEFFDLVNTCYAHLDGYVPVAGEVLESLLKQFTMIINTRYLALVVNENDELVALAACLADVTDLIRKSKGHMTLPFIFRLLRRIKRPKALECALIAVRPDYQKLGVNAILLNRILNNMIEDEIVHVESNPELVTNEAVLSQWATVEHTEVKRRRTFHKSI